MLAACLKDPFQLDDHGRGFKILNESVHGSALSAGERQVLELLRLDEFDSVEVKKMHGKPHQIIAKAQQKISEGTSIDGLLGTNPFQSVTAVKQNGRLVIVKREVSFIVTE